MQSLGATLGAVQCGHHRQTSAPPLHPTPHHPTRHLLRGNCRAGRHFATCVYTALSSSTQRLLHWSARLRSALSPASTLVVGGTRARERVAASSRRPGVLCGAPSSCHATPSAAVDCAASDCAAPALHPNPLSVLPPPLHQRLRCLSASAVLPQWDGGRCGRSRGCVGRGLALRLLHHLHVVLQHVADRGQNAVRPVGE